MVTVSVRTEVELVARGPAVGLLGQFALLGMLATGVGVGVAGWLTGTTYAVVTFAALTHALHRSGARLLGPANAVTLARATLVGAVTALVADSVAGRSTPVAVLVILATVALVLDGVDGQVARRTGSSSPLGARFDMEVDAFLILVLSAFVAQSAGVWVLAIGALRYLFVAAGYLLPWLRGPLPPRFSRKTVAALQGILLVVAGAGVLPPSGSAGVAGLALALLCWSFGRDVRWLWRGRRSAAAGATGRHRCTPAVRVPAQRVRPAPSALPAVAADA